MTIFAAALVQLFADPNIGVDAIWRPGGGGPGVPLRVVRRSPDDEVSFGGSTMIAETNLIDAIIFQCPDLRSGDVFEIEAEEFVVQGSPVRDRDRLLWQIELRPR